MDLYKEEILDHFKNPQNFKKLNEFDNFAKQTNPFCGDEIELYVQFKETQKNKRSSHIKINNISFLGKGCAICIAGTSLLTEYAKGKIKEELTKMTDHDMLDLLEIEVSQMRRKCALLGLYTLRDCLQDTK